MSGFTTSNGTIYGPNGNAFVARGIDVLYGNDPTAAQLQTDFPGINFVRLAVYNYDSPQSLAAYVNSLTSAGIVVELENHNNNAGGAGGSQGVIFTGQALTQEQNWYASVASYFKNNPNVWFGTNNEPSETDANGQNNPAALSAWQQTTYNTIRATGNNAPVMLETTSWGPSGTNVGYVASDYAGMHNVIWDQHYYGWISGYSTDQTTVTNTLNGTVSSLSSIKGADGTMPVIIGEYGNSTNGTAIDANANQVINAVQGSKLGNVAWAWLSGPGDALINSNGSLTSYGQQIAAGIAKQAAGAPAAPPPPGGSGASPAPSANDTVVMAGSGGSIVDASGNAWTIANGVVQMNGQAAGYSANVQEIAYVGGTVWQENTAGDWWGWSNNGWNTGNGTTTSPLPAKPAPSANDTVVQAGSTSAITDASGNAWTISNGAVQENGAAAGYSANVTEIAYVNGTVWQENASNLWWSWNGTTWSGAGTSTSPLPVTAPPVTPDTIVVSAGGIATPAKAPSTVSSDTFSLTSAGVTNAVLGATPTFVQFLGASGVNVTGGSAPSIVSASDGANSFTAGSGYMDVTGGAGADAYNFTASSKFLAVEDFSATKGDALNVASSLQSGMQTMTDGHNTLLMFGNGGLIELHGVTAAPTIHWT